MKDVSSLSSWRTRNKELIIPVTIRMFRDKIAAHHCYSLSVTGHVFTDSQRNKQQYYTCFNREIEQGQMIVGFWFDTRLWALDLKTFCERFTHICDHEYPFSSGCSICGEIRVSSVDTRFEELRQHSNMRGSQLGNKEMFLAKSHFATRQTLYCEEL